MTLIVGVLAGYIASRLVGNDHGLVGVFIYLAIGAFGASIGRSLFSWVGIKVTYKSPLLLKLFTSVIGAIIFILFLNLIV